MLLAILKLKIFHRLFRLRNRHNLMCVVNMCDMNRVQVGRKSYGAITVVDFSPADTKLIIGNYCSIAGGTTFLLGGEHNLDTISTYPFKVRLFGEEREAGSKGNIVIKDDVWIGQNAIICSGVTVGQGGCCCVRCCGHKRCRVLCNSRRKSCKVHKVQTGRKPS